MTREELDAYLGKIRDEDLMDTAWQIEKHDAEQRAEIDRAYKTNEYLVSQLKEWERICGKQQEEIARLKNDLSHWTFTRFQQLENENNILREAIQSIASNTCCNGCQEAKLVAQQALKETP